MQTTQFGNLLQLDDVTEFSVREKEAENMCVCVHQETQRNYFDFMAEVPKYFFFPEMLITFRIATEQVLLV